MAKTFALPQLSANTTSATLLSIPDTIYEITANSIFPSQWIPHSNGIFAVYWEVELIVLGMTLKGPSSRLPNREILTTSAASGFLLFPTELRNDVQLHQSRTSPFHVQFPRAGPESTLPGHFANQKGNRWLYLSEYGRNVVETPKLAHIFNSDSLQPSLLSATLTNLPPSVALLRTRSRILDYEFVLVLLFIVLSVKVDLGEEPLLIFLGYFSAQAKPQIVVSSESQDTYIPFTRRYLAGVRRFSAGFSQPEAYSTGLGETWDIGLQLEHLRPLVPPQESSLASTSFSFFKKSTSNPDATIDEDTKVNDPTSTPTETVMSQSSLLVFDFAAMSEDNALESEPLPSPDTRRPRFQATGDSTRQCFISIMGELEALQSRSSFNYSIEKTITLSELMEDPEFQRLFSVLRPSGAMSSGLSGDENFKLPQLLQPVRCKVRIHDDIHMVIGISRKSSRPPKLYFDAETASCYERSGKYSEFYMRRCHEDFGFPSCCNPRQERIVIFGSSNTDFENSMSNGIAELRSLLEQADRGQKVVLTCSQADGICTNMIGFARFLKPFLERGVEIELMVWWSNSKFCLFNLRLLVTQFYEKARGSIIEPYYEDFLNKLTRIAVNKEDMAKASRANKL
ncbi:hypothetical protein BKA64DRAFT_701096 [Cadophora sp. MPI-SDFR-AT-0126]|nr:hypothetical protein BKA64DRAFT_701096 [Leotiomycetes sp. MPI-SDFR-AT-0126]